MTFDNTSVGNCYQGTGKCSHARWGPSCFQMDEMYGRWTWCRSLKNQIRCCDTQKFAPPRSYLNIILSQNNLRYMDCQNWMFGLINLHVLSDRSKPSYIMETDKILLCFIRQKIFVRMKVLGIIRIFHFLSLPFTYSVKRHEYPSSSVVCLVLIDAVWEREQVNLTWVWWWVSNTAATSLTFMEGTR